MATVFTSTDYPGGVLVVRLPRGCTRRGGETVPNSALFAASERMASCDLCVKQIP